MIENKLPSLIIVRHAFAKSNFAGLSMAQADLHALEVAIIDLGNVLIEYTGVS